MKLKFTGLSLLYIRESNARLNRQNRYLQGSAPSRWEDCVTMKMTGAQCEEYILDSLGGDLNNHPIPELKIQQHPQRSSANFAKTYWNFGIPTNMFAEVDCELHGGSTIFPWEWEASDGKTYKLPWVPCAGLNALECCDAIEKMMDDEGIPTTDINGNCLSCWVHQEPLKPIIDDVSGEVVYVEHSYIDGTCVAISYTKAEVQSNDYAVEQSLVDVVSDIESLLSESSIACQDIVRIRRDVLLYGRSFTQAMSAASGLLCGQCNSGDETDEILLSKEQKHALELIKKDLSGTIQSDQNCIVIYTDQAGDKVLKIPQIGGSRNDTYVSNGGGGGTEGHDCEAPLQPDGRDGCMCPAIEDMAGNRAAWTPGGVSYTGGRGYCECPPTLVEFNEKCFCPDNYQIWDPVLLKCKCPHGTNTDGSCICPGPFSGLDWNNVGWIKNDDTCIIDYQCTLSEYDYYDNFDDGCNSCGAGSVAEGGGCVRDCNEALGFVFNQEQGACVCAQTAHVVIEGRCQCETIGEEIPEGETECVCAPPKVRVYDYQQQMFVCEGGGYYYYNYNRN